LVGLTVKTINGKTGRIVSVGKHCPEWVRVRWSSGTKTWFKITSPSKWFEIVEEDMGKPPEQELVEYKAMWSEVVSAAQAELNEAEAEVRRLTSRLEEAETRASEAANRISTLLSIESRNNSDLPF